MLLVNYSGDNNGKEWNYKTHFLYLLQFFFKFYCIEQWIVSF